MPTEIKELIMEFTGEKQKIKKYFLDNIANFIDPSLLYLENNCEFCYITILKTTNEDICDSCHYGSNEGITNKKIFSATTLITGSVSTLGKLYYALDDIHRFLFLMSLTDYYSTHPLTWVHYELFRSIRIIE